MKEEHEDELKNNDKTNRREFLQKIGLAGASAVVGGGAIYAGLKYEDKKHTNAKKALVFDENEHKLVEKDFTEVKLGESKVNTAGLSDLQKRGREGLPGKSFVMVIDLAKCKNARECMKACQNAHALRPEQHHINVLEMEDSEKTGKYYMPKPCQHCDNPPCVSVCPVDATFKRQDGIVLIDNERCIGCRFCMAGCPYSARVFNWAEPKPAESYNKDYAGKEYDVELNVPQKKGTISKCLFSADRLRKNELPYCVSACPNGVYYFGDANEDAVTNGTTKKTVKLSSLLKDNAGYTLMEELGTKPRVYYLPHRRNS